MRAFWLILKALFGPKKPNYQIAKEWKELINTQLQSLEIQKKSKQMRSVPKPLAPKRRAAETYSDDNKVLVAAVQIRQMVYQRLDAILQDYVMLMTRGEQLKTPGPATPEQTEQKQCIEISCNLDDERKAFNQAVTKFADNTPGRFDFAAQQNKQAEFERLDAWCKDLAKRIKENETRYLAVTEKLSTPDMQAFLKQKEQQESARQAQLQDITDSQEALEKERSELYRLIASLERLANQQSLLLSGDLKDAAILRNNMSALQAQISSIAMPRQITRSRAIRRT